ncbi:MAG: hypothetical protein AABZ57_03070, partial [Candidatus Margulisiibacteriota bacterium]
MGIGLTQNFSRDIQLSVSMMLSPRMMQMLKVLNVPYIELIENIKTEAEENPLIELEKHDRLLDYLRYSAKSPHRDAFDKSGAYKKDLETYSSKYKNMDEYLLSQLSCESLSKKEEEIAKSLIASINDNGYIADYSKTKQLIKSDLRAKDEEIERVLKIIQSLEPEGIAARDLKECLIIQVRRYNFEDEQLEAAIITAIEDYLEQLASKDFISVAKKLGVPPSGVEYIALFIKNNLNPFPGASFSESSAPAIPSFSVKLVKGSAKIENLEKKLGPCISINQKYLKMLDDPKTDSKTIEFLKEKLQKAKELLENLEKRGSTMEKVMEIIVEKQTPYFFGKEKVPAPLSQKELASCLGLHPSTISRSVAEKFVDTPK